MPAQSIPWAPIRSTLTEKFSFGDIKQIVGYGDLDMARLAHLEQKPQRGATKSQLLSEIDRQVGEMDDKRRSEFVFICCEEMMRRRPEVIEELDRVLSRVGWKFSGTALIPVEIFDAAELADLPEAAHADIQKAASRLRDGDLGGALSAACGALDAVTGDIYHRHGLGDAGKASFQERIRRSIDALQVKDRLIRELTEIGWDESDYKPLSANIDGSLNQAAFVMQKLRTDMGDVHGTKPVIAALVYDAIKWSSLLLRMLATR
ncbi:hypothetical protein [Xanthomonas hortorum]|uniref:Uncharacterized protein n=1 Tax=Xanthomonas hortorum pv. hederae TaxID=453603 RepID=A0A9X4BV72_9XANT|nr:hypothetical protein [Xanthomonas hortorum]MCE4369705.1 hypothetical protein [Xanthomonas hortorum pv. hederae]MDC8640218.1 hypothetical protein [Xanthomonas hortorum pv. hederae]PPU86243.1 hypothetical protein XhhCFBP4925_00490 [Xanthomonas hortorum pv. hederae]PUF01370.1 hypothetical protein C7T87_03360 [Xanthomonas hortorum pv. hederae]